ISQLNVEKVFSSQNTIIAEDNPILFFLLGFRADGDCKNTTKAIDNWWEKCTFDVQIEKSVILWKSSKRFWHFATKNRPLLVGGIFDNLIVSQKLPQKQFAIALEKTAGTSFGRDSLSLPICGENKSSNL
uniref:Hexosyltransferase n=1 Tax=Romanomermis culicivorax TaxID=13658 RepID=A0A915K8B0_ROMCU